MSPFKTMSSHKDPRVLALVTARFMMMKTPKHLFELICAMT